ncbi:CHAP domain-containing protein [Chitinibacter sp. GC72]|uniref:CHAP domain-containing protein n=1 Tax=Chitinibacter sp. GC72 TaxID=1526917 RepID=UPI0012FA83E5|nr:CHAP domain-containing protein [Chitinibacter sp. GC72]
MSTWNKEVAVKHAQDNAKAQSAGRCARYVREAIEAGGLVLSRHNSAKDYGNSLKTAGFTSLPANSKPQDGFSAGDVAILQGFDGNPHGHIQIYDGQQWISDFKQRDFWPGSSYRKNKPSYTVYQYAN